MNQTHAHQNGEPLATDLEMGHGGAHLPPEAQQEARPASRTRSDPATAAGPADCGDPAAAGPTGRVDPPREQQGQPAVAIQQQQLGWSAMNTKTLVVVATLIITLMYQVGTSGIPGGYWQDTQGRQTSCCTWPATPS